MFLILRLLISLKTHPEFKLRANSSSPLKWTIFGKLWKMGGFRIFSTKGDKRALASSDILYSAIAPFRMTKAKNLKQHIAFSSSNCETKITHQEICY